MVFTIGYGPINAGEGIPRGPGRDRVPAATPATTSRARPTATGSSRPSTRCGTRSQLHRRRDPLQPLLPQATAGGRLQEDRRDRFRPRGRTWRATPTGATSRSHARASRMSCRPFTTCGTWTWTSGDSLRISGPQLPQDLRPARSSSTAGNGRRWRPAPGIVSWSSRSSWAKGCSSTKAR